MEDIGPRATLRTPGDVAPSPKTSCCAPLSVGEAVMRGPRVDHTWTTRDSDPTGRDICAAVTVEEKSSAPRPRPRPLAPCGHQERTPCGCEAWRRGEGRRRPPHLAAGSAASCAAPHGKRQGPWARPVGPLKEMRKSWARSPRRPAATAGSVVLLGFSVKHVC